MSTHCVTNQRKSRVVVSMRACLRVAIVCVKGGTVKIISVCACLFVAITCQTAMNQRGEVWAAIPLITQSLLLSLYIFLPISTSSSLISAIIPHSLHRSVSFSHPTFPSFLSSCLVFIPPLSLEVCQMWRCVLCLSTQTLFTFFLYFFSCQLFTFSSVTVICNVRLLYLPISPLFLSCFVPKFQREFLRTPLTMSLMICCRERRTLTGTIQDIQDETRVHFLLFSVPVCVYVCVDFILFASIKS